MQAFSKWFHTYLSHDVLHKTYNYMKTHFYNISHETYISETFFYHCPLQKKTRSGLFIVVLYALVNLNVYFTSLRFILNFVQVKTIFKQYFVQVITCTRYFCTCYNLYFCIIQVITFTIFLYTL